MAGRLRRALAPARQAAASAASDALRSAVRAALAPRFAALAACRVEADALLSTLQAAERRAAAAALALDRSPVGPDTTVHAVHARHPGVQAIFARHGLPRCTDCAVGADETLAEAAFGEGFTLEKLLEELGALVEVAR